MIGIDQVGMCVFHEQTAPLEIRQRPGLMHSMIGPHEVVGLPGSTRLIDCMLH
jgi:hypothetical protein